MIVRGTWTHIPLPFYSVPRHNTEKVGSGVPGEDQRQDKGPTEKPSQEKPSPSSEPDLSQP